MITLRDHGKVIADVVGFDVFSGEYSSQELMYLLEMGEAYFEAIKNQPQLQIRARSLLEHAVEEAGDKSVRDEAASTLAIFGQYFPNLQSQLAKITSSEYNPASA